MLMGLCATKQATQNQSSVCRHISISASSCSSHCNFSLHEKSIGPNGKMLLRPFRFPDRLLKIPKFSWAQVKKRPEILGIYAVVATGVGLTSAYLLTNGMKKWEGTRRTANTDDPEFWIEYYSFISDF